MSLEELIFFEYNNIVIYHVPKDVDDDFIYEYWYSTNLGDEDYEFDVRKLSTYDEKLDHKTIIQKALDKKEIKY